MIEALGDLPLEHHNIQTNGVRLHVVQAGPTDGPLVVLLHGFPEFWYCWHHQIPALVKAGYRVCVPDQRGYNTSQKPRGVRAYRLDELAADIFGLIAALGRKESFVVGHDWGAAVCWWMAQKDPGPLRAIVNLNCPPAGVMRRAIFTRWEQFKRSWYIFAFQVPGLGEREIRKRDFARGAAMLQKTSSPGAFTDEDLVLYKQAWAQPNALRAMINWYRAAARYPSRARHPRIEVPALLIWGQRDIALSPWFPEEILKVCDDGRAEVLKDATHWVQHDEPERVNELLLSFLADQG